MRVLSELKYRARNKCRHPRPWGALIMVNVHSSKLCEVQFVVCGNQLIHIKPFFGILKWYLCQTLWASDGSVLWLRLNILIKCFCFLGMQHNDCYPRRVRQKCMQ